MIRVLIAEDDALVRSALSSLIDTQPDLEVIGEATDAQSAARLAAGSKPDLALLDVRMPGGGPEAAGEIRRISPQTRVLALSAYEDSTAVLEMLRAGAIGYLVKGGEGFDIVDAIRRAVRGEGLLSPTVIPNVLGQLVASLEDAEAMSEELQELDRTKSELIQTLSHELFTPITVIQGAVITLGNVRGALSEERLGELADSIGRAGSRLQRLVSNISVTATLDRDTQGVDAKPVPIGVLLDQVLGQLGDQRTRIRLPGGDTGDLRVWADPELAWRALAEVVDNALTLSSDDDAVEIAARPAGSDVLISVSDRGPGVPEELAEKIYESLTQLDGSATRTHDGLGIGLYLTKRIMGAHGGGIRSKPRPGGGTVFELAFRGTLGRAAAGLPRSAV